MLTRARRGVAARVHGDPGVTLMELLVTMVITSIIGAVVTSWLVSSSSAITTTTDADISTAQARSVLQGWVNMIQLGATNATPDNTDPGIQSIAENGASSGVDTVVVATRVANAASCPPDTSCTSLATTMVTLQLSGGKLYQTVGSGPKTIVVPATVTGNGPCGLFTAYSSSGKLACSTSLDCTASTNATTCDSIRQVLISFKVTGATGHTRSFQTTAAVTG